MEMIKTYAVHSVALHLKAFLTIGNFVQQVEKHGRPRASLWQRPAAEAGPELQSVQNHVAAGVTWLCT